MAPRKETYLFSIQGLVLLALVMHGDLTVDQLSSKTGASRWTVLRALRDLRQVDYVEVRRNGRRNTYSLNPDARFHNPLLRDRKIGVLFSAFREAPVEAEAARLVTSLRSGQEA